MSSGPDGNSWNSVGWCICGNLVSFWSPDNLWTQIKQLCNYDIVYWLVVGPPLWKIWKSIGMIIPNLWENKKCSKPPTSIKFSYEIMWNQVQCAPLVSILGIRTRHGAPTTAGESCISLDCFPSWGPEGEGIILGAFVGHQSAIFEEEWSKPKTTAPRWAQLHWFVCPTFQLAKNRTRAQLSSEGFCV